MPPLETHLYRCQTKHFFFLRLSDFKEQQVPFNKEWRPSSRCCKWVVNFSAYPVLSVSPLCVMVSHALKLHLCYHVENLAAQCVTRAQDFSHHIVMRPSLMTESSAAYISNVYGHQMVSCKLVSLVSQPAILRVSLCEAHTDWPSAQNQLTASLIIFGPSSTFPPPLGICGLVPNLPRYHLFFFFFSALTVCLSVPLHRHKRSNSGLLCLSFLYFSSPTQGHLPEAKICLRTCELIIHEASERAYICPAALMYGYL